MIQANLTELKAKLGHFMRAIRAGKEVQVTDRGRLIARLVPVKSNLGEERESLSFTPRHPTAPPLGDLKVKGIGFRKTSAMEFLLEDRRRI